VNITDPGEVEAGLYPSVQSKDLKMGPQFAFGNENGEDIYTRAQIEGEIYRHDLSLRKIDEERVQLTEGLAKNDFLRRLIMRRRREPWLPVDRTKSRNRASRSMGALR
jgi:hypothetical protein